jgi:hypothetical protein
VEEALSKARHNLTHFRALSLAPSPGVAVHGCDIEDISHPNHTRHKDIKNGQKSLQKQSRLSIFNYQLHSRTMLQHPEFPFRSKEPQALRLSRAVMRQICVGTP